MTIRPGNKDDALFLAKMVILAGRGHISRGIWEHALGCTEPEALVFLQLLAITSSPHLLHYSTCLLAEKDDEPVGCLGGYNPQELDFEAVKAAMPEVIPILGWSAAEHQVVLQRAQKLMPSFPEMADGCWFIESLATLPDHRRQGIAGKLLTAACERAKEKNHNCIQINLFMGNEAGMDFCRKAGFTVREEKPDEYFERMIGAPGLVSMVKEL